MFTKPIALAVAATLAAGAAFAEPVELGSRPLFLVDQMNDGALKDKLAACAGTEPSPTLFSIGHRGAALMFAEHTAESYTAAARQGAGIIECDVAFTADKELVCRHAQNDLHTTTNILATDLAAKCTTPFAPASGDANAKAECRTSDITLTEFLSLTGKMDAANAKATTVDAYMDATPAWRTDLYAAAGGTLLTHAQSIELIKSLGGKFTPELKTPAEEMPFDGFTMDAYAQKMIDEYKAAGIDPADVWPQSFDLSVVKYWVENEPDFGAQAVYLVEWHDGFDEQNPETWNEDFAALVEAGVNYLAPSINMMITSQNGAVAASAYAKAAKEAGLTLIGWTLERSGPLATGGGWYYQSAADVIDNDGYYLTVLDVLAQDVGIAGMFSDWPATVTYYANCMGL
ncbi:glycerophosphodiester phosphodiesterase family protein [Sinisalibacter aestuarii]|uniref:glycerophosphodiester phosphodiesterase n=1 Tax=Sinisalibacter aestuarii TaxID=2949426 RepID=A0ABQ5LV89_9RHOB|nr:glycerophosphodiester phosphodiesterase family protein [Sinisalibacter aestuarii]GKY88889.1 glycerophosphoryl diester phosphodiesterase [Sinisalibacter aestuarii]